MSSYFKNYEFIVIFCENKDKFTCGSNKELCKIKVTYEAVLIIIF